MSLCHECHSNPIAPGNRCYCGDCSRGASTRWRARPRRQWAERWRADGGQGPAPYLDGWPSAEARRAYYRAYMTAWRRQQAQRAE